jgi:hypothetical protein
VHLRCTNCEATFDGELTDRCPKCLRRTTVASTEVTPTTLAVPAPWPDGTACPLCLTSSVSAATFLVEIPSGAAPNADAAGKPPVSTTVRCRCCDACAARVVGLSRRRLVLLPLVALVMLAWPVLCVSELPMRLLHLEKLEAAFVVTVLSAVLVAMPLVVLDISSRAVRRNFQSSWLLRQLLARVRAQATGGPERPDEWKVLAEPARAGGAVVDAPELLRSG